MNLKNAFIAGELNLNDYMYAIAANIEFTEYLDQTFEGEVQVEDIFNELGEFDFNDNDQLNADIAIAKNNLQINNNILDVLSSDFLIDDVITSTAQMDLL